MNPELETGFWTILDYADNGICFDESRPKPNTKPTKSVAMPTLKPLEAITARILVIRDKRVLIDADLAALYGVTTKRLNEQVKRNKARFRTRISNSVSTSSSARSPRNSVRTIAPSWR